MKSYKELSEDVYSADYKYNPRTGRKTKAKRIAFNFSDADKKAEKDNEDAANDKKKEVKESTLLSFSEKMNLSKAKMGDVIKDFQDSDAPQFAGKSKEKRREMAIAAKMQADREMKEHVELEESTPNKQQVKQAIGIARDKRYAGGNMTGAVKAMDKLNKGLAQHPAVSKELKKQNEEVDKDEQEYGYEGAMAMTQLKTIVRHSEHLMEMLDPDTDLPEWVQSKITLATDYMQTAHDYLMSEMNEGWDDMLKAAKERNQPKPNGGAGKKEGSRYGGSKQKDEPVKEELKGGQKNLDKNKNGKLDAEDFKRLRKEESEQVDEVVRVRDTIRHALDKTHGEKGPTLQHKMDRHELSSAAKDRRAKTSGSGVSGFNARIKKKDQEHRDTGHVKAFNVKEEAEQIDETPKVDQGLSGKQKVAARAERGDNHRPFETGNTTGGQWRGRSDPSPYKDSKVAKSGERKGLITKSAIQKTKDLIKSRLNKEEAEQIDELSKDTVTKYRSAAFKDKADAEMNRGAGDFSQRYAAVVRYHKRKDGISSASKRIGQIDRGERKNEEVEYIDELSKGTLGSYIKKAANSAAIKRKIGSDFEHMADKSRKPSSKAAATTLADKYKSQSRDRRANIGKAVDRLTKEELEQIEERNKENAMKRKSMDASRGARYKAAGNKVPDAEPEHKTGQQHNKAIGRALRNEDDESKLSYSSFMKNFTK